MKKSSNEIQEIFDKLLNYFYSGVLAFVLLQSFQKAYKQRPLTTNEIFIETVVISAYNTLILTIANVLKPNSDSIYLGYLLNCLRNSKDGFGKDKYKEFIVFLDKFEGDLEKRENITEQIITIRDMTVAHVDRKHINDPSAIIQKSPISFEDLEIVISIIGSGLFEIGRYLGLDPNIENYTTIANVILASKAHKVYNMLYE